MHRSRRPRPAGPRPLPTMLFALLTCAAAAAQVGGVTRYCAPGATGAILSAGGSADLAANGGAGELELFGEGVPAGTVGVFFYGDRRGPETPFGAGLRCVASSTRLFRLPPVQAGETGTILHAALDASAPPSPEGTITPGSVFCFQLLFRDGAGFDLTDALEIAFVPPSPATPLRVVATGFRSTHPLGMETADGGALVLNDAASFEAFWTAHTAGAIPPPPPPPVDFSRDTIVAGFAGRRFTTGYALTVPEVLVSIGTLTVTTHETQPGPGCGALFSETQPWQIVALPRVDHAVLGERVRRVTQAPPCP